jgi:hypothetical protein
VLMMERRFAIYLQFLWRILPFIAFPSWIYVFNFGLIHWFQLPFSLVAGVFIWFCWVKKAYAGIAIRILSLFMVLRLMHGAVGYKLAENLSGEWSIQEPVSLPAGIAALNDGSLGGCHWNNTLLANKNVKFYECEEKLKFDFNGVQYGPGLYRSTLRTDDEKCNVLRNSHVQFNEVFEQVSIFQPTILSKCTIFESIKNASFDYGIVYYAVRRSDSDGADLGWFFGLRALIYVHEIVAADTGRVVAETRIIYINRTHLMAFITDLNEIEDLFGLTRPNYFESMKHYPYETLHVALMTFFDSEKFSKNREGRD